MHAALQSWGSVVCLLLPSIAVTASVPVQALILKSQLYLGLYIVHVQGN